MLDLLEAGGQTIGRLCLVSGGMKSTMSLQCDDHADAAHNKGILKKRRSSQRPEWANTSHISQLAVGLFATFFRLSND